MVSLALAACAPEDGLPAASAAGPRSPPASSAADRLADRVFAPLAAPTDASASATSPARVPVDARSADRGARLFGAKGCAVCHGSAAEGLVGPRLAGTPLSFDAVLRQVRSPSHPRMPPYPPEHLSDSQVAAIYAFLRLSPIAP